MRGERYSEYKGGLGVWNELDTEAIHPRVRVTRVRSFRPALIANLNPSSPPFDVGSPPSPLPRIVRRVIIDFPGDSTTDSRPPPVKSSSLLSFFFFAR